MTSPPSSGHGPDPAPQPAWSQQSQQSQQSAPPQEIWPAQQQVLVGAGAQLGQSQGLHTGPQVQYLQQPATGPHGYSYGPMPQYPPAQFPPPTQPPRRGVPAWMLVLVGVLAVAVVLVFALPSVLGRGGSPGGEETSTTQPDDGFGQPNTSSSGTFTGEHMVQTMNEALASRDRGAFFRFVSGDALPALSLWWDNMEVLGWTAGAFSVAPGQPDAYTDDVLTLRVTLGAVTAGSPTIPDDSPHPDAGLSYAPSNLYDATIAVTDDGASGVITGWELEGTAAPWDLEPLYAVIGENSLTAGYADEQALVDRIAPLSEIGAAWVVETYESETGVANAQQFATFVSEDPGRFNDWFIEDTSGWYGDRAGTMFTQRRPYPAPGISPDIATGGGSLNAGGILTLGPNGLLYGEANTQDTIVHEFVHAIHTTNVPAPSWPGSQLMEGWAVYNESLYRSDGEFGARFSYVGNMVRGCFAEESFTGQFPTQDDFIDVDTALCAYNLSGSMVAYADSLGVDVYAMADYGLQNGTTLPEAVAANGGPVIDEAGWIAWLEANFS